ncbi:unnamed protein product [Callosobruchus maculatus]|uniref:Uncharacterized protein n=1 Tax=Callosobruchus maculatus TaxID=64391 RepID=A0A653CN84_CALMS|nr:unnamed protein product [Callosobruchus maculatus]
MMRTTDDRPILTKQRRRHESILSFKPTGCFGCYLNLNGGTQDQQIRNLMTAFKKIKIFPTIPRDKLKTIKEMSISRFKIKVQESRYFLERNPKCIGQTTEQSQLQKKSDFMIYGSRHSLEDHWLLSI